MLKELIDVHKANDKAVMKTYGFKTSMSEEEITGELFILHSLKSKKIANNFNSSQMEELKLFVAFFFISESKNVISTYIIKLT